MTEARAALARRNTPERWEGVVGSSSGPELPETVEYLSLDALLGRFFEVEPRSLVLAEFGARSHRGKVREVNEDNYMVVRRRRERDVLLSSIPVELLPQSEQVAYTMAVADGVGGQAFGELASFLALRTGWEMGAGEVKWPVKINERESAEFKEKAAVLFQQIDRTIHDAASERPRLAGMATTLTACYIAGPELFVMHAGDSRAYLYRGGTLQRLTTDHTQSQRLIDAGLAAAGSPAERRRRHLLTNCLGGPTLNVEVDFDHHRLEDGDRLLLCTDGLTDLASEQEIAGLLERHPIPDDASSALVDLALERGGKDNVTAVVGRFSISGPASGPLGTPDAPPAQ
jgi:protein phosphatase